MNKRWLIIVLSLLSIGIIFEIFNNQVSLFLFITGVLSLLLQKRVKKDKQNLILLIGIISLLLAIFSSKIVLIVIVIASLLFIGENPKAINFFRENMTSYQKNENQNNFIMVDFEKNQGKNIHVSQNIWFGNENNTEDDIYQWEDVNYTKLAGNTVFDLGNTILPKELNIILIRKGFGNTKIIVPEGVAVSLDISLLLGDLIVGEERIALKNETFKWYSKNYDLNSRKIKIVSNHLMGEVEVVFV